MSARLPRVGAATRAKPGEQECGDQLAVVATRERLLVVVADGVGHGAPAALAARTAVELVVGAASPDLVRVLHDCDRALVRTRGAALAILSFDLATATLDFVGVGNVDVSASTTERLGLLSVPGVVGSRVRKVVPLRARAHPGDLLVLHTDGVSRRFRPDDFRRFEPQDAADRLLSQHGLLHDDATCVVIRF